MERGPNPKEAVEAVLDSLPQMMPLSCVPVETVSNAEADAYRTYRDQYQRYWRRYFDPIAIRLDDTPDGGLEAETFILPLIDNSLYNTLRRSVASKESGKPLQVPELNPRPVLMFSMNLHEAAWREMVGAMLSEILGRHTSINPAMIADLRPQVHLAIHDADPVIALGSGDIMGAFGGNMAVRGSEMMALPILISILTRPCTLMIKTTHPQQTIKMLNQASAVHSAPRNRRSWVGSPDFYSVDGKNKWIYALDVMGVVKLRYGVEVRGDWVFIQNIPWSENATMTNVENAPLNGARLAVFPGQCRISAAALSTAAGERARKAALESMGTLYPLLASGFADITNAPEVHERLFGFQPVHPGPGQWQWENKHVGSTAYGTIFQQKQPAPADNETALFSGLERLNVSMQFEADGLRTKVAWR